ncbi:hypothetical protein F4820DRAFT_248159 [Hypoxylon rubiginosum]|uniref:Uncharacterized protein n=1 Tax=Hypoxylon rubiginosum TaxID=110542 RepID=A0ACB9Z3V2_9PEZI|nr:hypothetical protein F4820DRAFT_248159 [Hypoxylon rubiginosum]
MSSVQKRKGAGEYSTNKNTIRARNRRGRISAQQREDEQGKANDCKAISRVKKILAEKIAYKMAGPEEQKRMMEKAEKDIMDSRRKKNIDHGGKMKALEKAQAMDSPSVALSSPSAALVSPTATYPLAPLASPSTTYPLTNPSPHLSADPSTEVQMDTTHDDDVSLGSLLNPEVGWDSDYAY